MNPYRIDQIAVTKFQIPPTRRELVARPRLVSKLNAGLDCRLTLVSAPAGSGKTTLLSDWSGGIKNPLVWISLNKGDNDPYRFFSSLITGFNNLKSQLNLVGQSSVQFPPLWDNQPGAQDLQFVAVNVVNEVSTFQFGEQPLFLILDDYHVIETEVIHQAMGFLLENLPPQVHIILSSRVDPPLPLARLRARGQINELNDNDLKFTREEAAIFLKNLLGSDLTVDELAILDEKIEGWAAGLQLAASILQGDRNVLNLAKAISGSDRYFFDYLTEEVLFHQPEQIQTFLMQTSILDSFNASLCNAVTGWEDSQAILEKLEQANLFIVPLDKERTWYRFHHLFIDLLRFRLKRLQGKDLPRLHSRASEWYVQNGMIFEAIGHALVAENFERAKELIEGTDSSITLRGEVKTLTGWLGKLPETLVRGSPRLSVIYAWALMLAADLDYMEARLNDAIRAFNLPRNFWSAWPVGLSEKDEGLLGEIVALSVAVSASRGNIQQAIFLAEDGLRNISSENSLCRGVIAEILGDVYRDMGNVPLAVQAYSNSIQYCQIAGNELGRMVSLDGIAWMRLAEGELSQAGQLFHQVIDWNKWQGQPLLPVAKAYVGLGFLLTERNDLGEAERHFLQGLTQCELGGYLRHLVTALSGLAVLKAAQGDYTEALAVVEKAIQAARGTSLDWALSNAFALRASFWLDPAVNKFSAALHWLENCGLHAADAPEYTREMEYLVYVRVQLACSRRGLGKDRLGDLLPLLERLFQAAEKTCRKTSQVSIRILQALVLEELGQTSRAILILENIMDLAMPLGFIRIFLDEGQPLKLLFQKALARGVSVGYIEKLLRSFSETQMVGPSSSSMESLTEREIEVLRLIARGLTNREICTALNISMGTANTHERHIFQKMGIHNRTQAIVRAREMGLVR